MYTIKCILVISDCSITIAHQGCASFYKHLNNSASTSLSYSSNTVYQDFAEYEMDYYYLNYINLTGSVFLSMSADSIFQNGTWINHKISQLHLSGLLLLAAFLKHSGKWSGVQMEVWPVLGWLWVAAQLCGVEKRCLL